MVSNGTFLDGNVRKYEVIGKDFPKLTMDELVVIFCHFGEIHQFLKHYYTREIFVSFFSADRSIATLNHRLIKQKRVRLERQTPRDQVIIRNIPKSFNRSTLFEFLRPFTPKLLHVTAYNDPTNEIWNRGFAYLQYPNHYIVSQKNELAAIKHKYLHYQCQSGNAATRHHPNI